MDRVCKLCSAPSDLITQQNWGAWLWAELGENVAEGLRAGCEASHYWTSAAAGGRFINFFPSTKKPTPL